MDNVKPCPFCGKEPTFSTFPLTDIIKCENANCYVKPRIGREHEFCKHAESIGWLIKAWNRRDGHAEQDH